MIRWCLVFIFFCWSISALATHNRSGEITYKHLNGNTYEFTITTCTKLTSEANKDRLGINYGDGFIDTLFLIQFIDYPNTDTKKNIYIGTHTFTGPGTFLITVEDPNRNADVLNIVNSITTIFCIQTQLIISPFLGIANNSLLFDDCPCPENACAGQPWVYNLGAYDIDGDSLSYSIIPCKGEDCLDLPIPSVFQYPQDIGGGTMTIDPVFGTITWSSPTIQGEYNFAIKINEYRSGILIGYVIRDMQITVKGNCGNAAPVLSNFADTCVLADSTLIKTLTASDSPASPGDIPVLNWDYFGAAFNLTNAPAIFVNIDAPGNPISGTFSWTPTCAAVRQAPYLITIEASDQGPGVSLKDLSSTRIKVNGPPIENLQISASLNEADLIWNQADCPQITGYKIYRSFDSTYASNSCCGNDEALNLGYQKIGETVSKTDTTFQDPGPLVAGNKYCYTVTAIYSNDAESCLVPPVCVALPFDLPIITHVTVDSTSFDFGIDSIRWTHPLELDTLLYTGPYQYKLYRGEDFASPSLLVYSSPISSSISALDTFFVDLNISTTAYPYSYQVELLNNGVAVGRSSIAHSIYIIPTPVDNGVQLNWEVITPWNNFSYEIYRNDGDGLPFVLHAITDTNFFADYNLVNGQEHCYRVRSIGRYSLNALSDTLYNWSQFICATAYDNEPPCPPGNVTITGNCETLTNIITWTNPNNTCADDVVAYQLFYSPTKDGNYSQIQTFNIATDTTFLYQDSNSIAGCFYVKASDSIIYNNQSISSDTVCVDNCDPIYALPNVFTPNLDGPNDLYTAILPFKFISRVEFYAINRWGEEVFYTEDPKINWNGFDQKENKLLTSGVYFYRCRVYAITLEGEVPFELHGFIHLIHDK
jgi:gliding motility-associated-like protein